ncbi:tyrosine-protein phosphatase [Nocardia bovistercoris]|uniref:Tyrosine-protein phosphatase n=1 Tax=Nocardia bovistercoris TaxID=2785916 RepID=A0A931N4I6_9NOCA|nr:tyrosine-protein phosphatase [Nocardia bovistercoris]MBH0781790.1 tyrosine-protein phosphatase [Nocardia bovistercoris]
MAEDGMALADRALPLRGAVNARDLGGLRTEDGRRVRAMRVLRSDGPNELDGDDVTYLLEHCLLRMVLDLRAPGEIDTDGRGGLADRVALYQNTHIFGADRIRLDLARVAPTGGLLDRYIGYLEHSAHNIVAALDLLASADNLPALVHCAAGKDRTGVVVAILLGVLGVREDDIVADYAATGPNVEALLARARRAATARAAGIDIAEIPAWVFAADAATMRGLLAHLSKEFGGPAAWATRAGLEDATRRRLVDTLLEPAR